MSLARHAAEQLTTAQEYFDRSTAVQSLAAARAWFEQAIAIAVATIATNSEGDLTLPLPRGVVMAARRALPSSVRLQIIRHTIVEPLRCTRG